MTNIRKNETRTQAEIDAETSKRRAQMAAFMALSPDERTEMIEKSMLNGSMPVPAKISLQ